MKSKVKAKWVVKIPSESQVLVKEHEYVSKGDSLIVMSSETTKSYDMSVFLTKVSPQKIEELKISLENRVVKEGEKKCIVRIKATNISLPQIIWR